MQRSANSVMLIMPASQNSGSYPLASYLGWRECLQRTDSRPIRIDESAP